MWNNRPGFEPMLPPPSLPTGGTTGGGGGGWGSGGGMTWRFRPKAPDTPTTPPPSDFDRLADAVTALYSSKGGGTAAPPAVVTQGGGSSGNAGAGKLIVFGVIAALIAWAIVHHLHPAKAAA